MYFTKVYKTNKVLVSLKALFVVQLTLVIVIIYKLVLPYSLIIKLVKINKHRPRIIAFCRAPLYV